MKSQDIENMVRWSVDVELRQFSEDAYGVTGTAFDRTRLANDDYLRGKFQQMKSNFIMWIAGLSENNRTRLATAITIYEKENK